MGLGRAVRAICPNVHGRRFQVIGSLLGYAAVVYPMELALRSAQHLPWWVYPFLTLRPVGLLVGGSWELGAWQLFTASFAVRFAWSMLRGARSPVRRVETEP